MGLPWVHQLLAMLTYRNITGLCRRGPWTPMVTWVLLLGILWDSGGSHETFKGLPLVNIGVLQRAFHVAFV